MRNQYVSILSSRRDLSLLILTVPNIIGSVGFGMPLLSRFIGLPIGTKTAATDGGNGLNRTMSMFGNILGHVLLRSDLASLKSLIGPNGTMNTRASRAIDALRKPDASLSRVSNTIRQSIAEVIDDQKRQVDKYGLALMMIREGVADPSKFAAETLEKCSRAQALAEAEMSKSQP